MGKQVQRIFLSIIFWVLVSLLSAEVTATETALIWQTTDTPPFWGENLPNNGMGGEIMEALSKQIGKTNRFVYQPKARMQRINYFSGNWTGNPAVFPPGQEWSAVVPIMTLQGTLFFFAPHHEQPPQFRNWKNLSGMTLGAVRGVLYEAEKRALEGLGITIEESRTQISLLHKLVRNRIDVCFMIQGTGLCLIQQLFHDQREQFVHFAVRRTEAPIAIMLAKDLPDGTALGKVFDAALDNLINSGEYEKILEKYYGTGNAPRYWKIALEKFREQYK